MSEDAKLTLEKLGLLIGFLVGIALVVCSDWRIALGLFLMLKCSEVITAHRGKS